MSVEQIKHPPIQMKTKIDKQQQILDELNDAKIVIRELWIKTTSIKLWTKVNEELECSPVLWSFELMQHILHGSSNQFDFIDIRMNRRSNEGERYHFDFRRNLLIRFIVTSYICFPFETTTHTHTHRFNLWIIAWTFYIIVQCMWLNDDVNFVS